MPRHVISKETRKAINDAKRLVERLKASDGNEAETRRRVERIFETVLGYDAFEHLSREHAVRGAGETEHIDFSITVQKGEEAQPAILVELKRIGINLSRKHLKQVTSYAIDMGCEWALLTNALEWRVYHIEFGQPPETKLIAEWNMLEDDIASIARYFEMISLKNVKRGGLAKLWEKMDILTNKNLLKALFSAASLKLTCKILRKQTGVAVLPEDILIGARKLLNEAALSDFSGIKITLPVRKKRTKKVARKKAEPYAEVASTETEAQESIPEPKHEES
ncbi:MAG: type I restriction enzyme HsdR N-terminal domain-containing protein [Candidatus Lernaella stagnicola]|nr:type I restriction enzyme HsdR N-terminal domain-containing protein [Candidatus Lernaella stagnicola]